MTWDNEDTHSLGGSEASRPGGGWGFQRKEGSDVPGLSRIDVSHTGGHALFGSGHHVLSKNQAMKHYECSRLSWPLVGKE